MMMADYHEMRMVTVRGSTAIRAVYTDGRGREYVIIDGIKLYRGLHW